MTSGSPFSEEGDRRRLRVGRGDEGERLDRFLFEALGRQSAAGEAAPSRRALRRAIEAGAVWVDGQRVRVSSRKVRAGSRVELVLDSGELPEPRQPPRLDDRIVYEDDHLIAIDKPAGLPSQATPDDALGNAHEAVRRLLSARRSAQEGSEEVYVALHHRLDRGTSGILLMAKDRRANAGLAEVFRGGEVIKIYRALCVPSGVDALGGPDPEIEIEIDRPLVREGRKMRTLDVDEAQSLETRPSRAQSASTRLRILGSWRQGAEERARRLEARPLTGRRHQVRTHLAALGWPVLGDRLYGTSHGDPGVPMPGRPLLHAASLELAHPVSGAPVLIECPVPADFEAVERDLDARFGPPELSDRR